MPGRLNHHLPMPDVDRDIHSVSEEWNMYPFPHDVRGMLNNPDNMPNLDAIIQRMNLTVAAFTSILATATAREQYYILGENLCPLVEELEHDNALKITGMLLELPLAEVLHLLVSEDALNARVAEAMEVLMGAPLASSSADQADSHSPVITLFLGCLSWFGAIWNQLFSSEATRN
ncbi:unnamed protein product [Fraxinus pennsylvanica]|uniref:PABC domain-containing protein n=1 Tax=Fraxinus pennsylvanica TaxID=56036 RepID=A0AAD1Z2C1_9LAMI|nr:unnamed protein product [Fraxinus pennsylvanica]